MRDKCGIYLDIQRSSIAFAQVLFGGLDGVMRIRYGRITQIFQGVLYCIDLLQLVASAIEMDMP